MAIQYPFAPELLDALPEELAELYRGLEIRLLTLIAEQIKAAGELNESSVQKIRALRSHGIAIEAINKAIAETVEISGQKLDELLDDVVERNQKYYTELIDIAKVTAPPKLVDESDIVAIRRQTWSAYKNITGSMGFIVVQGGRLKMLEPSKAYHWALDSAALAVESGAISYNQAIRDAVIQLADSGIKTVDYESGRRDHVDVAVRRAVMTGITQINNQYAIQSMDYLNTDLVQVSAHVGARDVLRPGDPEFVAHVKWQGKVYRWKR